MLLLLSSQQIWHGVLPANLLDFYEHVAVSLIVLLQFLISTCTALKAQIIHPLLYLFTCLFTYFTCLLFRWSSFLICSLARVHPGRPATILHPATALHQDPGHLRAGWTPHLNAMVMVTMITPQPEATLLSRAP